MSAGTGAVLEKVDGPREVRVRGRGCGGGERQEKRAGDGRGERQENRTGGDGGGGGYDFESNDRKKSVFDGWYRQSTTICLITTERLFSCVFIIVFSRHGNTDGLWVPRDRGRNGNRIPLLSLPPPPQSIKQMSFF